MTSRYPSDLTDAEWKRVKPILDRFQFVKHHPRELLNAMLHLVKSGLQWRMLPAGFPPWQTVYYHFRKWQRQNLFQRLRPSGWPRPNPTSRSRGRRTEALSQCCDRRQPVGPNRSPRRPEPRPRPQQASQRKKTTRDYRYIGPSARRTGRICKRFGRSMPAGLASATARKSPTPESDLRRRRIRGRASKLDVAVLSLDAPRRKPRRFPAGLHALAEALGRGTNVWMV